MGCGLVLLDEGREQGFFVVLQTSQGAGLGVGQPTPSKHQQYFLAGLLT